MKRLALFAAFALWATPAFAQTASVSQTGDNQTAAVTQTGSASNEAYVTQLSDNTPPTLDGPQTSTVLQNGVSNYAFVQMSQTGGGSSSVANDAFLRQVGDHNDMRQYVNAPGYNSGQDVWAEQVGNRNVGRQQVNTGHTDYLELEQRGDRNDAGQYAEGAHITAEIYQTGSRNTARQNLVGSNFGYSSSTVTIDQDGDSNEAYQTLRGGGSSTFNTANVDQNGNSNYVRQEGDGSDFYLRVRQDGNSNWARTNSVGDENYLNARMSDGAYLRATQTGNMNNLFGTGGAGTEARILNGSSLTMTQTGDMNSSFVNMVTGGTATISQIGNSNTATVIQN